MTKLSDRCFIEDLSLCGKQVLVRVDFNVPLDENLRVTDNARIAAALPTINRVIEQGGRTVLMSHLGRPKGRRVESMSLRPAKAELERLLNGRVTLAPECIGGEVEKLVSEMKDGDVILLENLRFHQGETRNDPGFCEALARLGEVYINDAFGTAHRAHASTSGVVRFMKEAAVGYLIRKELQFLGDAVLDPQTPFAAILGGAKVADKIRVIEKLLEKIQFLLIGGGMACTFLKAQGHEIGGSLLEEDSLDYARGLLKQASDMGVKLLLPEDVVIAKEMTAEASTKTVDIEAGVPEGWKILDIGPESVSRFSETVRQAKTVLWNGPMGVFEVAPFAAGTLGISNALADATSSGTVTIVGGGDSAAAIRQFGLTAEMSHISTGGGASLEFLEGRDLPGVSLIPASQTRNK